MNTTVIYVVLFLRLIRWHAFVLIANAAYAVVALVMTALATRNSGCVEVYLQLAFIALSIALSTASLKPI